MTKILSVLVQLLVASGVASAQSFPVDPAGQNNAPSTPGTPAWFSPPADSGAGSTRITYETAGTNLPPPQAAVFEQFAPRVKVSWDDQYLYVQNNGLPAHGMMVGITAWQQQVPLPQPYFGENAWAIPLHPVPAKQPRSIKNNFLRGAIAVAVNGIPIFNPQNNRGEISKEIGELDLWGGHCGRADDYHYHVAPIFLQSVVGRGRPVAYALDGYPVYGPTEPDGTAPLGLDACGGHYTAALGYHYHASTNYPYVIAGFHGEVTELNGQVDPQPRARPVRPAQPPLPGATITGFTVSPDEKNFALKYTVDGQPAAVNYEDIGRGFWKFQFLNADGTEREATYRSGGQNGRPPRQNDPPPRQDRPRQPSETGPNGMAGAVNFVPKRSGTFVLRSSAVTNGGALPVDYTGDGKSSTLPLDWTGAPAETKSYAVIMHHIDPQGITKWYWILYDIPASIHSLPKNVRGIGTLGNNSVNDEPGYAPPHSKGPGPKTYILTVYALSAPVQLSVPPPEVSRDVLLAAMKDLILDSAELRVVYDRTGIIDKNGEDGQNDNQRNP